MQGLGDAAYLLCMLCCHNLQAQAMVAGFTNPVYKSFRTRQEAADFLAQHGSSNSGKAYGTVRGADGEAAGEQQQQQQRVGLGRTAGQLLRCIWSPKLA
jgi:hypothetical protein